VQINWIGENFMAGTGAGRKRERAEIVALPCPQCGFAESICQVRRFEEDGLSFLTCPQCGYAEESWRDQFRQWKGNGVYVVHQEGEMVKAGAFPEEIAPEEIPALVADFLRFQRAAVYLTRWNSAENRLEILLGGEDEA
jgi:Zn ribbon nucleic-acid-binding protein